MQKQNFFKRHFNLLKDIYNNAKLPFFFILIATALYLLLVILYQLGLQIIHPWFSLTVFLLLITFGLLFAFYLNASIKILSRNTFFIIAIILFIAIIFIYGISYHILPYDNNNHILMNKQIANPLSFGDSMYFSIATITTLGYGDIVPFGNFKWITAIEALSGFIYIALTLHLFSLLPKKSHKEF